MNGGIEQVLFAGTFVQTEIVNRLSEDETVEQMFIVFLFVDGSLSSLSVIKEM